MRIIQDRQRALNLGEFLSRPLFAHLGTASTDGDPRVSPVWFLWENPSIWILGNLSSDTFPDRVTSHSACALAVEDYDRQTGRVHHVGMRGNATIEPFDVELAKRLLRRYLGQDENLWDRERFIDSLEDPANVLVRFEPDTVVVRDVSYLAPRPQPEPRLRVTCYVTRPGSTGDLDLLVFDHADSPGSGTQVPAGGVIGDETFPQAALREVREETGLHDVQFVRLLGDCDRPHPENGSARSTMYVHLHATGESPDQWSHVVTGPGDDNNLRFDCRWVTLPITLADDQHELIWRLNESTGTDRQDSLDGDIRQALLADDRVLAALAYGSRMTGEDDAHSDIEYWIVADTQWDLAGMLKQVETPLSLSRNQFGSDVAIWADLVRGEFHTIRPDELHLIAAWPQRGAPVERMVIKDDPSGRLAQTLDSLPEEQPRPQTPDEIAAVCEQFANWWLMSWHLQQRGEQERFRLVLSLARECLLAMARLRHRATQHWLSQESKFEIEVPTHLVSAIRRVDYDDCTGLWNLGRHLWVDLADRHRFPIPTRLFNEIDQALRSRRKP